MKIKRNSWHYKVRNWGSYEKRHDSLCVYFWCVVGSIAFWVTITTIAIGVMIALCILLFEPQVTHIWIAILFVGLSAFLPWYTITQLRQKYQSPQLPGENILVEYIKTKKAKICPIIEYVD